MDDEVVMECRESRRPFGLLLMMGSAAILAFVATIHDGERVDVVFGWLAIAVLSGLLGWRLICHTKSNPDVRIDDRGLQDKRLRLLIPWQRIEVIRVNAREHALLLFISNNHNVPLRRLKSLKHPFGMTDGQLHVTISLKGLAPGVEEAWTFLRTNYRNKTGEAAD